MNDESVEGDMSRFPPTDPFLRDALPTPFAPPQIPEPAAPPPQAPPVAPVARQQRISSIDVLRGVAVLGILLMNIVGFGLPYWAYEDPSVVPGGSSGANLWTWIINSMLFEGTFRAIFSMLFGAGVVLLTSRLEERRATQQTTTGGASGPSVAAIYYRRNLWLMAFGMVNAWVLLWPGDVLYLYGLIGLLLYPLRHVRPRYLIAAALATLLVMDAIYVWDWHDTVTLSAAANAAEDARANGQTLSPEQEETIKTWEAKVAETKSTPEKMQKQIDTVHGGYLHLMRALVPINVFLETVEVVKSGLWDAGGMMLLGMALLKLSVLSASRSQRFYLVMLLVGYAVGLSVNAYETALVVRNDFSVESQAQATLTYDVGRMAMALGHIALVMLIVKTGVMRWITARLAAVGQMALSNYLMQSVLCGLVFYGYGLGLFNRLERWQLYLVVLGVWILQLSVSPMWLARFQFGPAEWLWRSLTYWRAQSMRRNVDQLTTPVL